MAAAEVVRIETAIANGNLKELERALWYCQMRRGHPTTLAAHRRFWEELEVRVQGALAPVVEVKSYPSKKKRGGRGLGLGGSW